MINMAGMRYNVIGIAIRKDVLKIFVFFCCIR